MEAQFSASKFATPDQLWGAASFVSKEWGSTGYTLGVAANTGAVAIFEVRHFDGSTFNVCCDRWGNAREIPEGADMQVAESIIKDMHRKAVAA